MRAGGRCPTVPGSGCSAVRAGLVLGLLLLACAPDDPPALEVGPVAYSEDQLLGLSESRREVLARLVAFGLVVADSLQEEVGRPVTQQAEEDRVLEILAAEKVLEEAGIGGAVLEARYRTAPEFELTVRHILFFSERWRTDSHREAARAKAQRALQQLREGADFAETAARLSEEPGAESRAGLLTPGREGAWVDEFWAAASVLSVGEISPVTETQYGYHILRLEGRDTVPFAEARPGLVREVAPQVGDPSAYLEQWSGPEARAAALAEARERGLSVPEAEMDALVRAWTDTTYRWATALGFRAGMGPDEVAAAALRALASTSQNAVIARNELAARHELLLGRYRDAPATGGATMAPETTPPQRP